MYTVHLFYSSNKINIKLHKLDMELCLFDINDSVCQSTANLGQFEFQSQIFTEHSFQSRYWQLELPQPPTPPPAPSSPLLLYYHQKDAFTYMYTNYSLLQVNDIAFHPVHFCLLATVGSDGKFSFWDKDARTKLKVSITCCF